MSTDDKKARLRLRVNGDIKINLSKMIESEGFDDVDEETLFSYLETFIEELEEEISESVKSEINTKQDYEDTTINTKLEVGDRNF